MHLTRLITGQWEITAAVKFHLFTSMFIHMVFAGCGSWFYCFKILHAFLSSPMLATNPAHLILLIFHHPYSIWWAVRIQKFLIMQFPLTCCCLEVLICFLSTKYSNILNPHMQLHIYHIHFYARYEAKPYTTILFTIIKWFDILR